LEFSDALTKYIDTEALMLLFVAVVRPNLEFGNAVWSPKLEKQNLVESVQRRATRIILGLKGMPYDEKSMLMKLPSLCYVIDVGVVTSLKYACIPGVYTRSQKDY
jgi:hypothetical protein